MLHDTLGRAADLTQLALGHGVLRSAFAALRALRPGAFARLRHEPYAARGDAFVRRASTLEKVAFVAKMLGTDGGWRARARRLPNDLAAGEDEILFAGDLLFPGDVDDASLSRALRERIARSSCFVVNLEATVGERGHDIAPLLTRRGIQQLLAYEGDPLDGDWVSRFDVESLRALFASVPRVLASVANNHTLDDGVEGFDRTVTSLRALGIGVIGDARERDGTATIDVGPHRVGVFALSYGNNRLEPRHPSQLPFDAVPYRLSRARARALVDRLRSRGATHIVAILHWGYEHEHEPAPEQRRCAEVLFDAGVSALIGHHPHLAQPSASEDGRWVSYSLGDFVGGDRTIWSRFAAMVSLRFASGGAVRGEIVPVVQTPFWKRQRTMLLAEAPALERAVFSRYFADRL